MKRILSLILIFTVIFSSAVFGATPTPDRSAAAQELLGELDLLPESFNANTKMSREKFVVFLLKVMNITPSDSGKPFPFSDVSNKSDTYLPIKTAFELGFINGTGEGFSPKESITYAQAVKVIVSALGYDEFAKSMGGYPSGYLIVANQLSLTDGIGGDIGDKLRSSAAAVLMYNALDCALMQKVGFEKGGIKYSAESGETLLNVYHNIYKKKAQLRGTKNILLSGEYTMADDNILLDSELYKTNGKDFDKYVGHRIYAYIDIETDTVLAMENQRQTENTLMIEAEEIDFFSGGMLYYFRNDKNLNVTIKGEADVNYNGRAAKEVDSELFSLSDGSVTFIDSDFNGIYDVVLISEFENYVVSGVAVDERAVYDLYDSKKSLKVGDSDLIFKDDFGNTMYFEELKKYDVLSVWKSQDGENIKIRYSNKEIRAGVDEITRGKGGYAALDGEEIYFADNFVCRAETLSVGDSGTFVLDASGKIAAFIQSDDRQYYGYLVSSAAGDSKLSQELLVRIFNTNGEMEIFSCNKERLEIDGEKKSVREALEILALSQLIRYSFDSEGKIIMIDTVREGEGDNDKLTLTYTSYDSSYQVVSENRVRYSRAAKLFSGKVPIDDGVIIFNVPYANEIADDDEYYLSKISEFSDASYYHFASYKADEESFNADVLIRYHETGSGGAGILSKTPVTVVDSVVKAVNENGEVVTKLYCYYDGAKYREYLFANDELLSGLLNSEGEKHTLKKGDIVRLNVNENNGKIAGIELVYDREGDYLVNGAKIGESDYFVSERFVKGTVFEKKGNYISLTQADVQGGAEVSENMKELHFLDTGRILIYDSREKEPRVTAGAMSDVRDFATFGDLCSKAVIFNIDGGANSTVVIYK